MNTPCRLAVVLPTYNNAETLVSVAESVLAMGYTLIVVADGCTDGTEECLPFLREKGAEIVSYQPNRGKGYALRQGFLKAESMGMTHVATLDADGQHKASDLPALEEAMNRQPEALIVGSRWTRTVDGVPQGNRFANRFSNFWFRLQTGIALSDTQTGLRLYPVYRMNKACRGITARYEAELCMLVMSAWHGIPLTEVPVHVYYPPKEERVSHFRPGADFARISLLNTVLCVAALVYALPLKLVRCLKNH